MINLKREIKSLNVVFAAVVAALLLLIDFAVWSAVGSPIYILRFISAYVKVFPLWLFGLLDFLSFSLLGFALGAVLGAGNPSCDVYKYRGAFFFVIGLVLAYLHHVTFFCAGRFFISLIIVIIQCFFGVLAALNFSKVSGVATVVFVLGGIWWIYLLLVNIFSFFMM